MDNLNLPEALPVIGKYVIENLTVGMYDDPYCIFREYIQNSADALDKAIDTGTLTHSDAAISVEIRADERRIVFEDNGTGIPVKEVATMLQNVAQSEKQISHDKGFRGIGRLGGLAYCEQLVFETSAAGESTKSTMAWDARLLKQLVSDRTSKESAAGVISRVTSFTSSYEIPDAHYFRVSLVGVTNAQLLDRTAVKDYLSLVAPVPFDGHFLFRNQIYAEMNRVGCNPDEYTVYLNSEQVYKPYTTVIYGENNGKRVQKGEVRDVVFFSASDRDSKPLYWGWYSVSSVQNEQLKPINLARGLRLRRNNIQIGNERRLASLFRDTRFNFYVFGEVYALHPALIPNGRRDDFEDAPVYNRLKEDLKTVCNTIQALSYKTSQVRNDQKHIVEYQSLVSEVEQKQTTGFTNSEEIQRTKALLRQKQQKAEEAEKRLSRLVATVENVPTPLRVILEDVTLPQTSRVEELPPPVITNKALRVDQLERLNKEQRKIMQRVYNVITRAMPRDVAENLIQKIEEEFR
jgi:hypothetical protein